MDRRALRIAAALVVAAVLAGVAVMAMTRGEPAAETGERFADGELSRSQDRAAQASLRNAMAAAKVHFADAQTYEGFDPEAAAAIEPSLTWTGNTAASEGVVSIDLAIGTQIVMSTVSESGRPFCIADDALGGGVTYGRVDAAGAVATVDCSGGW